MHDEDLIDLHILFSNNIYLVTRNKIINKIAKARAKVSLDRHIFILLIYLII